MRPVVADNFPMLPKLVACTQNAAGDTASPLAQPKRSIPLANTLLSGPVSHQTHPT
jgi:hypothetical protein